MWAVYPVGKRSICLRTVGLRTVTNADLWQVSRCGAVFGHKPQKARKPHRLFLYTTAALLTCVFVSAASLWVLAWNPAPDSWTPFIARPDISWVSAHSLSHSMAAGVEHAMLRPCRENPHVYYLQPFHTAID